MNEPPLSQGAGYAIILGVGLTFALCMIATTWCLKRYRHETINADEFTTAGRTVSSSLISVGVISSWCWPTSILVSASQVYNYGICGGLYYAAGCGSVCFLFALLAMEVKKKAPNCHTYLELVKIRFGVQAHLIYTFFALAINIIVTVEIINGASDVFHYLTGMHVVAASFLTVIPVGIYTLFGGLKATFLTDYVHSIIMLILALVFALNAYTTNPHIGSVSKMYDLLQKYTELSPVQGNKDGSLMTIRSTGGGVFLIMALSSAITPIFLDQGYWNKALAASPKSVMPGYVIGGISWCAIPFGLATVMGLSLRVLENTEVFPRILSAKEISAGLVLPSAATALMGRNGAACAFLLLFMSVTSAASAEMVSASTVIAYDIYRAYINPKASERQLMWATHASVVGFIFSMVGFSIGLYYAGVDLGFLFDLIAIVCGGALIPASTMLFWSGMNKWSAIVSPILGTVSGIAAYLGTMAGLFEHQINMDTASATYPNLAGMLVSCGSPIVYIALCQVIFGNARFDFDELKNHVFNELDESVIECSDEKVNTIATVRDAKPLQKSLKVPRAICLLIPLALLIIWPMPMYGSGYVFSKPFFTGWIVVSIIWMWAALLLISVFPLWQGRKTICQTVLAILQGKSSQDLTDKDKQYQATRLSLDN